MKLSIIIVNFNTAEFLVNCIESIYKYSGSLDFEVIVVDNASNKGDLDQIKNQISKIKNTYKKSNITIIQNDKNLGFAVANNQGIRQTKGEYILLLNPDTLITEKVLPYVVNFLEQNPKVGIATCRVSLTNGKLDDACHRGFPTPWNAFCQFSGLSGIFAKSKLLNGYHLGYCDLDKTHEIDACAGAFMLIRRKAGEDVGWLDKDYFWYGEDLDFCYRVKRAGWNVMFVPDVYIIHYKGVAGGIKKHSQHLTTADDKTKLLATRARFDVMRIFYKKHYKHRYPRLIKWLVLGGIRFKEYLTLLKYQNSLNFLIT